MNQEKINEIMECQQNIEELCRICLENLDETSSVPLNSEILNGVTVRGMILPLLMNKEENLDEEFPLNVCHKCLERLKIAYEVQQTIIKSRKRLKELIKSRKTENFPEFEDDIEFVPIEKEEEYISDTEKSSDEILPALPKTQKIKIAKLSKFECGLCDKVYTNFVAFRIHFRRHTGERPYLCSFCSKSFSVKAVLLKHIKRIHTEEGVVKKHQCPYCDHKTNDVYYFKNHINSHTGEKPDICQICGRAFNGKSGLRAHMKTHGSEKNFKCRFCDKTFNVKKSLEKHEMVHQNIKPYECEVCQHAFTQKGDLLKHLKSHKIDLSHKCEQCEKTFRLKIELRRHMIEHPVKIT